MDYLAAAELQATVAAIGNFDGVKYYPDEDCVECIKDLIRFLRRDDENHEVRRAIGDLGVVKSDLIPILRDHSQNRELFDVCLRLLVNLTQPEILLFKEELPDEKTRRNYYLQLQGQRIQYKEDFVDNDLWKVLADYLRKLISKDWDERLEDDKLILERILILIRNILQVPSNVRTEGRAEGDATLHDNILFVLNKSGMQDMILYMSCTDTEMNYCMHIVEIVTLMLREQDPTSLANSSVSRSEEEKKNDEEALRRAISKERQEKRLESRKIVSTRHSRFGGAYVIKNVKGVSDHSMVVHKPVADLSSIDFDERAKRVKKAKNRKTPRNTDQVRRSTLAVRIFLKEFCLEFLLSSYNQIMNVVKDAINRQRGQLNDESYYLRCMKFFMEFNRAHDFDTGLVSETLSKQSFHFLQQQIENYRDNFDFEKKNRPKYLMWAQRMHLAIKAYNELLLNLVQMESSKDEGVREAGHVIRSGVFYEPEYRELCLQQLSTFNPDRMSLDYLKDLVHTTHVFLKIMEHMSKNKHLLVSKKTKKKPTKSGGKKSKSGATAVAGGSNRASKEEQWDRVSPLLSSFLQGKGSLPEDVVPFDAASDVSIEDQKVEALKRLQGALVNQKAGLAIALLRAARQVWPEGDVFGAADAEAEDDFMALREVLFADLGTNDHPVEGEQQEAEGEEANEEENPGEEEEEEEEMEEQRIYSVEQEFDYKAFVGRFAVKNVVRPFGILFHNYENNSKTTNHYIIKMFHRIAIDCGLPAMIFQASIFRVFQRIWKDLQARPDDTSLRELAKFAKYILREFMNVAVKNKKVFMELLFWKSSRDAHEIMEGYGTASSKAGQKNSFWSEEDEQKLTDIFRQVKEMEKDNPGADILDQIESMYIHEKRTRRQIGNKLKNLGLINNFKEITSKPLGSKRVWTEEEVAKLTTLYHEYKDAEHPANRIHEQWKLANLTARSKTKLIEKIMELNLCQDRAKLGRVRKRRRQAGPRGDGGGADAASETDSALEDSSSGEEDDESETEDEAAADGPAAAAACDRGLVPTCKLWLENNTPTQAAADLDDPSAAANDQAGAGGEARAALGATLTWLARALASEAEDREEEDEEAEEVPVVPLLEDQANALLDQKFQDVLECLGLSRPSDGEQFWRIPVDISAQALKARALVVERVVEGAEDPLEGVESNLLTTTRGMKAVLEQKSRKKKKKKKRGANKWQPFRRPQEDEAVGPASSTPKPAAKSAAASASRAKKNRSFLESDSDDDTAANKAPKQALDAAAAAHDKESNAPPAAPISREIVDTDDSSSDDDTGMAAKKNSQPVQVQPKAKSGIDKAKLLKLLNDDDSDISSDSDDEDAEREEEEAADKDGGDDVASTKGKGQKKSVARKPAKKSAEPTSSNQNSDKDEEEEVPNKKGKKAAKPRAKKGEASKKKPAPAKKSGKKKMAADSSDDDDEPAAAVPPKKAAPKRKAKGKQKKETDESEEEPAKESASSGDEMPAKKKTKKNSIASSSEDESEKKEERSSKATKRSMLDSDSEDEQAKEDETQKEKSPAGDNLSQSFDSRLDDSRLNDSRLDDSRLNDSRLDDSRLDDSRLNDSRLSYDSRLNSPAVNRTRSSSRSRSRSSSRSSLRSVSTGPSRSPSSSPRGSPVSSPAKKTPAKKTPAKKKANPPSAAKASRTPLSLKNVAATAPDSSGMKRKRGASSPAPNQGEEENSPVKPNSKRRATAVIDSDSD